MQKKETAIPSEETNTKRVSQKTLNDLVLFNDALLKPIKLNANIKINANAGVVVKLPADWTPRYEDGEGWKRVLDRERLVNIGDTVLYSCKIEIILEGQVFHLANYFIGKINDKQSNN